MKSAALYSSQKIRYVHFLGLYRTTLDENTTFISHRFNFVIGLPLSLFSFSNIDFIFCYQEMQKKIIGQDANNRLLHWPELVEQLLTANLEIVMPR